MSKLLRRYKSLPWTARWGIAGILLLIAYLGVVSPILNVLDSMNARVRSLEKSIARDKELSTINGDGWTIETGQAMFGRPHRPGDGAVTAESFTRVVNSVLESHGVTDRNVSESSVPLAGDNAIALGVGEIKRLILQVSFEADAATVIAVLADLERRAEVASVSRVRLESASGRNADADPDALRATLSTEGWISSFVDPALASGSTSASAATGTTPPASKPEEEP